MYILDVIPIARGISKETLSYFTSKIVPPGHIIKAPLRKKTIPAIVVNNRDVREMKSELRASDFQMRKIEKIQSVDFLREAYIESAKEAAAYFAGTTGSVLNSLIPKAVIEDALELTRPARPVTEIPAAKNPHEKFVIQAPDEERLAQYKSLIRENFAKKQSVVFCLPTIHDIKRIMDSLPKGIEDYTYIVHGALSKKELLATWEKIPNVDHPVLIIGTGISLAIPRYDIGAIIMDRESSGAYKVQSRPFVDIRTFAEFFAKRISAKLIFGDVILRTETLYRYKNQELVELIPLKFRSLSPATQTTVDMKQYKADGKEKFHIFSTELEDVIRGLKEKNENLFLFGARKGLAPMTVCGDCGTIVQCNNCNAPVVLHSSAKGNFFLCHHCGERRDAMEKCRTCDSWKLVPLGVGIEGIEKELNEKFPDIKVFRIDKDTVTTLKKGLTVINKFYSSPGSILIGTELALLYLDKKIENTAIVSIDSLFSLPDFRINEKIMSLIVKARNSADKHFILQTRNVEQPIWNYAISGNLMDFYRDELKERERYEYPPFWMFIKLTVSGDKTRVQKEMANLENVLKPYILHTFPTFIERVKGRFIMHGVIKLPQKSWVDKTLLEKLTSLPPYVVVKVDPESLL